MSYIVNPTSGKKELLDEHMASQLVARGDWEYEEGSTIQVLYRADDDERPKVYDLNPEEAAKWVRKGGEVLTKESADRYGYEYAADYPDKYGDYGTTAAALGVLDNLSWYQGKNLLNKMGLPASKIIRDNPWEHGLADAGTGLATIVGLGLAQAYTGGPVSPASAATVPAAAVQTAKLGARGKQLYGLLKKGLHYTPGPVGHRVFTGLARAPAAGGLGIAGAAAGAATVGPAGVAPGFLLGTAAGKKFFRETMHQLPAKVLGPTGAPGGAIIDKLGVLYGTGNLVNNIFRGHGGRIAGLGGEAMVYGLGYGISEADWDKPLPEIAEYISNVAGMSAGIGLGVSGGITGIVGGAKFGIKGAFSLSRKGHEVFRDSSVATSIDNALDFTEGVFSGKSKAERMKTTPLKKLDAAGAAHREQIKQLVHDLPEIEKEANEIIQDVLDVDSTIRSWDQIGFDGAWLMKRVNKFVEDGDVDLQVNPALAAHEALKLISVLRDQIKRLHGIGQDALVVGPDGNPIKTSRIIGLDDIKLEVGIKPDPDVAREILPMEQMDYDIVKDWGNILDATEAEILTDLNLLATSAREGLDNVAATGYHLTPELVQAHKESLREYAKDRVAHLGKIYDETYFDSSGKLQKPHPEGKEYLEYLDNRVLPEDVTVIFRPIAKKEGTYAQTHIIEKDGNFKYKIQLDYKKLVDGWKRKDWENPTVKGVLPLHELANNTPEALRLRFKDPDDWIHFILEHELQHVVTPKEAFHSAIAGEKALFERTFWGHLERLKDLIDDHPGIGPDEALEQFETGVARAFRKAEQAIRKGRAKEKKPQVDHAGPLESARKSDWVELIPDDAPDLGEYDGGLVGVQRRQLEAARRAVEGEKPLDEGIAGELEPSELDIADSPIVDLMRIISDKSISHKEQRRVLKIAMSELEESEITRRKMKLTSDGEYENYINRKALEVSQEIAPRYKHRVKALEGFLDDAINEESIKHNALGSLEAIEDYAPEIFDNDVGRKLTVLLFKQFEELASDIHVRERNGELSKRLSESNIPTRMKDFIRKHLSDDDRARAIKDPDGFNIKPNVENRKPYGGLGKAKTELDDLFFRRESSADEVKKSFAVKNQNDHRTWDADPNKVKEWMNSLSGENYNQQIPVLLNYLEHTNDLFQKLVKDGHYGGASGTPHAREVMRRRFGKTYTDEQWAKLLEKQADKIKKMHKRGKELNEEFTSDEMRHALAWIGATAREGSESEINRLRLSMMASPIGWGSAGALAGNFIGGPAGALALGALGTFAGPILKLAGDRVGNEKLFLRKIAMIEAMHKGGEKAVNEGIESMAKGLNVKWMGPAEAKGALKYPRALMSREIALQVEGSSNLTAGFVGPQEEWKKKKEEEKKKGKKLSKNLNKFGAEEFDNAKRILNGLMDNPEMLEKVVRFSTQDLEGAMPQLTAALGVHWKNAIRHMTEVINKASPKTDETKVFAKKVVPPDSVLHDIGEKLKIFDQSFIAIFKKMENGTLTQSDVDFFKKINPFLWGSMVEKFTVILQDEDIRDNLDEQEQRMIKLLIGEEENTALHSALQRHYLPAGEGEGGGMAGQPERKGSAKKMDLPTGQTMMDIVERGPTGAMAGTALA